MSKVKLKHASGNSMSIAAPATNPASDLELKLPATIGTAGQVLKNSSTPGTLEFGNDAGKILQVVQEVRTSTWSVIVGGSTYSSAAISKAITTSSSSSKVLVFMNVNVGYEGGDDMGFALYRGGSVVSGYTGDAASNRMRVASQTAVGNIYQQEILTGCYLDSPGSAATHTYDIRLYYRGDNSVDRYIHVNKANNDGDTYDKTRSASSLTLIEVAA